MATKTKVKEEISDKPSLKRIMAEVNRKYGPNTLSSMESMATVRGDRFPIGLPAFDNALGGGFPGGRIVELYGLPSSGKSLICLLTIAEAQKKGKSCIYIDAENTFDPIFAKALGVDVEHLIVSQVSIGEDAFDIMFRLLEAEPDIIVIDSVAGLIPRKEMEDTMDDQNMALQARLMSRGVKKANALNKKTLILFINQIRSTLTMYGAPTTTPGGLALKFFASVRVEVKQPSEKLRKDDKKTTEVIGQIVQFKVTKNKTASPFQEGSFKFWYEDYRVE